jgi:hypothetical protein
MDQWTDLRGMAPEEAKSYVLAHLTDLKLLQQRVAEAEAECASWQARVSLAETKGLVELQAQAAAKLAESRSKADSLKAEELALAKDIETMRQQVPGLAARVRSVDPDILLAGLQMVTGEMDDPDKGKLEAEVKHIQADDALSALKVSLGMAPPVQAEAPPTAPQAPPTAQDMETAEEPAATPPKEEPPAP